MGRLVTRWLLAAGSARQLAIVRIALALYAVVWLGFSLPELVALGRMDGGRFEPVGIVALLAVGPIGPGAIVACWGLTIVAAITVATGRLHRVAGPVFAAGLLFLTTYQNSWGKLLHTENLLVIHALVLAASPAGEALVLGGSRAGGRSPRYGWPIRAMALATVLAYVAAGVAKLRHGGLGWMAAENLQHWLAYDLVRKELFGDPYLSPVVGLLDHGWPFVLAAGFTVVVELVAPVALVGGRWTTAWVASAWLMHAGVLVVMAVGFPYQLVGVAFLPLLVSQIDQPVTRRVERIQSGRSTWMAGR